MAHIRLVPLLVPLLLASRLGAADLYVDPVAGDDAAGLGTEISPWKTIHFALTQASAGDVVHAAAGVYSTSSGEVFPLKIIGGVRVVGAGIGQTVLHGSGAPSSFMLDARTQEGPPSFATFSKATIRNAQLGAAMLIEDDLYWSLRIEDVRFEGVTLPVQAGNDQTFVLERCEIVGAGNALITSASNGKFSSLTFRDGLILDSQGAGTANGYQGGHAGLAVARTRIEGCGLGFVAGESSSVGLEGCLVTGCGTALKSDLLSTLHVWRSTVTANDVGIATMGTIPWTQLITVHGSIVRGNALSDLDPAMIFESSYSDTSPVLPGVGCVDVDPAFVDPLQGDWHLSAASPLVDAGDPALLLGTDLDGDPRVLDGDLSGAARIDVGYDERNAVRLSTPSTATPGGALPFAVDAPAGFATALFVALGTADVPVGAFGSLLLDPAGAFQVGAASAPWSGALPVPPALALGTSVHLQAAALDLALGVGSLSNRVTVDIE